MKTTTTKTTTTKTTSMKVTTVETTSMKTTTMKTTTTKTTTTKTITTKTMTKETTNMPSPHFPVQSCPSPNATGRNVEKICYKWMLRCCVTQSNALNNFCSHASLSQRRRGVNLGPVCLNTHKTMSVWTIFAHNNVCLKYLCTQQCLSADTKHCMSEHTAQTFLSAHTVHGLSSNLTEQNVHTAHCTPQLHTAHCILHKYYTIQTHVVRACPGCPPSSQTAVKIAKCDLSSLRQRAMVLRCTLKSVLHHVALHRTVYIDTCAKWSVLCFKVCSKQ